MYTHHIVINLMCNDYLFIGFLTRGDDDDDDNNDNSF